MRQPAPLRRHVGHQRSPDRRARVLVAIPVHIKQFAATVTDSNLNDEIVGRLADHYDVPFEPTGLQIGNVALHSDGKFLLRMPTMLKRKVVRDAVRRGSNQTDVINYILAEAYGLTYEPRSSRTVPFGGGHR